MTDKRPAWTPGPWRVWHRGDSAQIRADDGKTNIALLYIKAVADMHANGRLIAAAPELYEALGALEFYADECAKILDEKGYVNKAQHLSALVTKARAVLSLARGEPKP